MMRAVLFYVTPYSAYILTYMLQQSDYNNRALLQWWWHDLRLQKVLRRGRLDCTLRARVTLGLLLAVWLALVVGIGYAVYAANDWRVAILYFVIPFLMLLITVALNEVAQALVNRRRQQMVDRVFLSLHEHKAKRIAVLGSYGKTTLKELLVAVFSQSDTHKLAWTQKNKNVLISHTRWAYNLRGDEDVLIVEFGEEKPGDIAKMSSFFEPDIAIVTGIAPMHVDGYGNIAAIKQDLLSIKDYVNDHAYLNTDSAYLDEGDIDAGVLVGYSSTAVGEWRISDVIVDIEGLSFVMKRGSESVAIRSGLVGRHLVAPVALSVVIATDFGVPMKTIQQALAAAQPFAHRMQPYRLNGAWVIDDTYNGNITGMKAGLALLAELPAKRKFYVTPGLVEQGGHGQQTHQELGQAIAQAAPDRVYLFDNSVKRFIVDALESAGYGGELIVVHDALEFYNNLDLLVSAGDIIMLQNDWPDGYV